MYKSIEKFTRGSSYIPGVVEFYPDDIKQIADRGENIKKGLRSRFMVITHIPGASSDKPAGYHAEVYADPMFSESTEIAPLAKIDVGPNDAFTFYDRVQNSKIVTKLYKITPPALLKDRVAWALGATKKQNEKRTLDDLRKHYETLLTAYVISERTDGHEPIRVFHGNFEAVIDFDEDGTANRNSSAYFIKGYPTKDEALDLLKFVRRRNGWYFSSIAKIDYMINLINL